MGAVRVVQRNFAGIQVHEDEAGGVPDLVGEVAVGFDAGDAELHVVAGRAAGEQGEAEGIVAVGGDEVEGIEGVAEAFAHFAAVFGADEAVEVDVVEGHLAGEVEAHHDHAGDPEEEDVVAGFEHGCRVELCEVRGERVLRPVPFFCCFELGPAEGAEGARGRC